MKENWQRRFKIQGSPNIFFNPWTNFPIFALYRNIFWEINLKVACWFLWKLESRIWGIDNFLHSQLRAFTLGGGCPPRREFLADLIITWNWAPMRCIFVLISNMTPALLLSRDYKVKRCAFKQYCNYLWRYYSTNSL